ncbi:amino acid ABC transporter permease [Aurantimonas sp. Leaf443]|uniref:amino acid ABC transporter permease n=1 Tax=Aurantimonas sp. Leaf443 TaxID=1736378 RepID=UPI0006F88BB7|nr:amino acid ABC transporter permease [Aurantimonas sp. Leaf443]KQT86294.1 amino acid ABC transporter permease [Aurantimonas sp. Leaf443]
MEEQVALYVARDQKQPLPPPPGETGLVGRMRRNLFATPLDTVLTIALGAVLVWGIWNLFQWAVVDAVFEGSDRTACLVEGGGHGGACWAFVKAKFGQFIYGIYPLEERWRIDLVFLLLAALVIPIAMPTVPGKKLNAVLLFLVFPVVTLVLLTGGEFSVTGGEVAILIVFAAGLTVSRVASRPDVSSRTPLLKAAYALMAVAVLALIFSGIVTAARVEFLDVRFTPLTLLAFAAALGATALSVFAALAARSGASAVQLLSPIVGAVLFLFVVSHDFGLEPVPTNFWGGLMLTLVVALTGITASLPLGILLALGRRSDMPAIKLLSVIFIEFWRGVPLITVLFMANFMLPLFVPDGVTFNQLLRALVGVALFSAAYMAEVIRGGLQAIPKGQYEGADAMALTYWQKMRLVVLPQALKLVIPGIVNTFIGLFKDTSLVYIIGLADLLGTVRRGFADPAWITPSTPATGLVFAGFLFWLFCFSMSRYSVFMERRLDTGHKR